MTEDTRWDLTPLYSSLGEVDEHVTSLRKAYEDFAQKWQDRSDYLEDSEVLFEALEDYEGLNELSPMKPYFYLYLRYTTNQDDTAVEAKLNQVEQKMAEIGNLVLFFTLKLGNLEESQQNKFLKADRLKPFHYQLERIFLESEYQLSENEEQIINLLTPPAHSMWVKGLEKQLSRKSISMDGNQIPLAKARNIFSDLSTAKRREVWQAIISTAKEEVDFAESELNAVVTRKKILDDRRGYEHPYSSRILADEVTEKSIISFVDLVTKNFSLAHEFYALKAQILGEDKLTYADRSATIGEINTDFSYQKQVEILKEGFASFHDDYADILDRFVKDRQIDVEPRQGKKGGAYCWGSIYGVPTYVFLNNADNYKSLTTFAHEMGHAIHSEMTKASQPARYLSYTIPVAETASTLFERAVFEHVFPKLSVEEQIIALHDKINDGVSTIFRQIALFNFERDLHKVIRNNGFFDKQSMAELLQKHQQSYVGNQVEVSLEDGFEYVMWPHIRMFFYVYSYAFGELLSRSLFSLFQEDPGNEEKIRAFLRAGGSMSVREIFLLADIDIHDPAMWQKGLYNFQKDVERLRGLIKQRDDK